MSDINLLKKDIRKELIKKRSLLDDDLRENYDKAILDKLTGLKEYNDADLILTYASYNGEVDTMALIDRCINEGKQVACPRCRIEDGNALLDFYRITSVNDLKEGYKGIPEPEDDPINKLTDKDITGSLIIVPMVGYDSAGNRLGYGKGFYDRFLGSLNKVKSIGLAYSLQEYDVLPTDEYDVKPDMIINEK